MGNDNAKGGPPPSRASAATKGSTAIDAISVTRDAQETLDKKIEHYQKKILEERRLAKECLAQKTNKEYNKKKALRHLKTASNLTAQVSKFEGMRDNLGGIQNTLEDGAIAINMRSAFAQANTAMKTMTKELNNEKIDELTLDLQESKDTVDEATAMLSQPMAGDTIADAEAEADMDELMKELNEEEGIEVEEPVVKVKKPAPKLPNLPVAPTSAVKNKPIADEEDADDLAKLEREFAN